MLTGANTWTQGIKINTGGMVRIWQCTQPQASTLCRAMPDVDCSEAHGTATYIWQGVQTWRPTAVAGAGQRGQPWLSPFYKTFIGLVVRFQRLFVWLPIAVGFRR